MKKFARLLAPLLASLLFSSAALAANTITIDFESLPGADGVLGTGDDVPTANQNMDALGEKYSAVGVHFSQGTLFQSSYFNGDPSNHFISSTSPIGTFSVPVFGISIDSVSYWNAILTGYDRFGNVLASSVLVNPNSGSAALQGSVSIASASAIYSFSILPPVAGQILNLDNLVLTVSAVPEPHQYLMLVLGLMLIAGYARNRARR